MNAILKRSRRRQILAEEHVRRVDRIHHIAEGRIVIHPQLDVIAGHELSFAQREHHVLQTHWPLEARSLVGFGGFEPEVPVRIAFRSLTGHFEIPGGVFDTRQVRRGLGDGGFRRKLARARFSSPARWDGPRSGKCLPRDGKHIVAGIDRRLDLALKDFDAVNSLHELHRRQTLPTDRMDFQRVGVRVAQIPQVGSRADELLNGGLRRLRPSRHAFSRNLRLNAHRHLSGFVQMHRQVLDVFRQAVNSTMRSASGSHSHHSSGSPNGGLI